ncbi:MAG: KEOPS complex subunit Cgi121 [Candidatus Bathyarchaeia archaeon]
MSLKEFGRYVAIAGFRNAQVEDVDDLFNLVRKKVADVDVQFFDANLIAGWEHLYFATLNALKAFESKLNISNSLAMETLLYASAQRQISKAIDLMGIKPDSSQIAVLIVARTLEETESALEIVSKLVSGERDDNILELTDDKIERIRKLFDISDLELESKLKRNGLKREALVDLVIEHGALLVTQR